MLTVGGDRIRIRPWKGSSHTASIVPMPAHVAVRPATVSRLIGEVRSRGYHTLLTSALSPSEQEPFFDAGFTVHHELHLLCHPLTSLKAPERRLMRRAWRKDWDDILAVDHLAFNDFWRMDRIGISDALTATPVRRFRVTKGPTIGGYHISGRAGSAGYLQRLAVHPELHGQGMGSLLLADALCWMADGGATTAWVNTQVGNDTALALYERRGFMLQPSRLAVLTQEVPPESPQQIRAASPPERLASPPSSSP